MSTNERPGILVFRELHLWHVCGAFAARDIVLKHLSDPWIHNTEWETERQSSFESDLLALRRKPTSNSPGALLWMVAGNSGRYQVSNIVPSETGEFGKNGYNELLNDFVNAVVLMAAEKSGLEYHLSSETQSLTDWVDEGVAKSLERFSSLANMSTGHGHPKDRDRWLDFLIATHRQKSSLTTEQLLQWLIDTGGWPTSTASELASEYSLSRSLLFKYDELDQPHRL